jgi:hypothetical protein
MTELHHHGVKGMHWGRRKDNHGLGTTSGETKVLKTSDKSKLRQHLDSLKRERDWHKVIGQMDNMSTKDIRIVSKRVGLENNLKTLSKSRVGMTKIGTAKDKQDYLRRHEMSDQELARKVARLQAKENLVKSVKTASKEQREVGVKAVKAVGSLGLKYATTKKINVKDIFDAVDNPTIKTKQDAWDNGIKIAEGKVKHPKAKAALGLAKNVKFKQPKS